MRPDGPFFPLQTSSTWPLLPFLSFFSPFSDFFFSLSTLAISSFPISFNYKISQVIWAHFWVSVITSNSWMYQGYFKLSMFKAEFIIFPSFVPQPHFLRMRWCHILKRMQGRELRGHRFHPGHTGCEPEVIIHPYLQSKWMGWWHQIPSTLHSFGSSHPKSITLPGSQGWNLSVIFHPHINSVLKWKGDFSNN